MIEEEGTNKAADDTLPASVAVSVAVTVRRGTGGRQTWLVRVAVHPSVKAKPVSVEGLDTVVFAAMVQGAYLLLLWHKNTPQAVVVSMLCVPAGI